LKHKNNFPPSSEKISHNLPSSRQISIKWKLLLYLTGFVGVLLILLWLFQIVLMEPFYKQIKVQSIKSIASSVAKSIDDASLRPHLESLAAREQICVRIVNSNGIDTMAAVKHQSDIPSCIIHTLMPSQLRTFYSLAESNGGTALEIFSRETLSAFISGNVPLFRRENVETMLYGTLVTTASGNKVMILLDSVITPINTTVETLRIQLVSISVIMLVLSVSLAFILSGHISKPIVKINDSAKLLADGQYDISFDGHGYKEISELSDTLNYTAGELGKVENMRREFIANVSHDLRTPLTMITGYGEVMRDLPGENTPENLQIIIDEASRLSTLVNDILDLSKLQSGQQKVEMEHFDLTEIINETLLRYSKLILHDGYRIDFVHDCSAWIYGDRTRITQVLYNLINNAITYTGEDKCVTVRQTLSEGFVRIDIIDSGEGIAPENLPYIWERYYKFDKNHKRASIGTGLGLSIVKGIMELHSGRYGVESALSKGSCFWFALPLSYPPNGEKSSPASNEQRP